MPSLDEIFKQMPNAALAYLKDQKLDEIECVIADLTGIARGKAVPATKFARQNTFYLPDRTDPHSIPV